MALRFIVTAGPTREHLDPVRFLTNPSTGRMGFAVARAAAKRGHETILVTGPVSLRTPAGVTRRDVVSARDMAQAVSDALAAAREDTTNILVATAAVADWRPAKMADKKLKKSKALGVLKLVRNPDILKSATGCLKIGFAAETGADTDEAARKCREKGCALVVLNDVTEPGAGFGVKTNRVIFVTPDGAARPQRLLSKAALGAKIVRFCERLVP